MDKEKILKDWDNLGFKQASHCEGCEEQLKSYLLSSISKERIDLYEEFIKFIRLAILLAPNLVVTESPEKVEGGIDAMQALVSHLENSLKKEIRNREEIIDSQNKVLYRMLPISKIFGKLKLSKWKSKNNQSKKHE